MWPAKLITGVLLALVFTQVQCIGACLSLHSAEPPCHHRHSQSQPARPDGCPHVVTASPAVVPNGPVVAPPAVTCAAAAILSEAVFRAQVLIRACDASSPPGRYGPESTVLRI